MVRITAKTQKAKQALIELQRRLTPEALDAITDKAAFQTQAALIRATPKKWFGQVRRGWLVIKPRPGQRVVVNSNPIMLFIEAGTRDHGPRETIGPLRPGERRKKAALFIPLTRRAVNATAGKPEFSEVDQFTVKGVQYWERVRAIINRKQSVRKGRERRGKQVFIFGVDYILARRVRGIRPRKIVEAERPKARVRLRLLMDNFVRKIVKGL